MNLDQLEALALGPDPDAVVATLGGEDHDGWRVIRLQHAGDLDGADAILGSWRHGKTAVHARLVDRQLLLRADRDLDAHADALADRYGARLDHQPDREAEAPRHPSALDPAALDPNRVLRAALQRDKSGGDLTADGLAAVLANLEAFGGAALRRAVLGRLGRTGLPGLLDAWVAELAEPGTTGFGTPLHLRATLAELDALAARVPALRTDAGWVAATVARLRPPPQVDLHADVVARIQWLDAVWDRIRDLPPPFGALQVHVAYHRLAADLERDTPDAERLRRYLALPRRIGYGPAAWDGDRALARLDATFPATGLPAVHDDEALVSAYLAALLEPGLLDPASFDAGDLADRVEARWLRRRVAEARLVAGDPTSDAVRQWERAYGSEDEVRALRERVELELLPTNPRRIAADAPVIVRVALKNPGPLRIRVYRIDVAAHVARTGADVDLGIDLDGLGPTWEEVRPWPHPPIRRIRTELAIPACDRPGTWIVELVGNGRASRLLVHKGALRVLPHPDIGGVAVTVVDDAGSPAPDAVIRLGDRELRAGDDGAIHLPFSTSGGGPRTVVVCAGPLVVPATVTLPVESYALGASWQVDRQALVPGREAAAVVRLDLTVDGHPLPASALEDAYAEVTTVDRFGIPGRRRVRLAPEDGVDLVVPIAVPDHAASLTLAVGGRIRVRSEQRTVDLRHEFPGLDLATIHASPATEQWLAVRSADGWRLGLVGKTGEPRPGRVATVSLTHRLGGRPIEQTLATDPTGWIALGSLPGIVRIRAVSRATDQGFDLRPAAPVVPAAIHARVGDVVIVPVPVGVDGLPPEPAQWSVIERRGGAPAVDHAPLAVAAPGQLRITGLPPGEHEVTTPSATVTVRIAPAPSTSSLSPTGWTTTPTASFEVPAPPTALRDVAIGPDGGVTITVDHPTADTRVH
ncbi:MAG: hypothetical protein ABMB14_13880, partial [Myxococcota bacterium]